MLDQRQTATQEKGRTPLHLKQTCAELDTLPLWRKIACALGLARLSGTKSKTTREFLPEPASELSQNSSPAQARIAEQEAVPAFPGVAAERGTPRAKLTYARLESLDAYLRDKTKREANSLLSSPAPELSSPGA